MFSYDPVKKECKLLKTDLTSTCTWATPDYATVGAMQDYYLYDKGGKPKADGCTTGTEALDWANDNGGYRGCQHKTRSGTSCVVWADITDSAIKTAEAQATFGTDGTHAYCRNPNNASGGRKKTIFCYTKLDATEWEYCDPIAIPNDQGLTSE
jgi:hypothetical protein